MGGWPVVYLQNAVEEWDSGVPRTNADNGKVEDSIQGPLDFKSSTLDHSASPPPQREKEKTLKSYIIINHNETRKVKDGGD